MLMFYFTYLTYVLLIKKLSELYIMLYNELHINMLWKKKNWTVSTLDEPILKLDPVASF